MRRKASRIRAFYIIILTWGFGGISCGGAQSGDRAEPKVPVDEDLLELMPETLPGCLWFHVAQFRETAVYRAVETFLGEDRDEFLSEVTPFDVFHESDEILFGFAPGTAGGDDQFLTLIKGTFDRTKVITAFSQKKGANVEKFNDIDIIHTKKFSAAALTDRTIAVGRESLVKQATVLAKRQGRSLRENPTFADLKLEKTSTFVLKYAVQSTAEAELSAERLTHTEVNVQGITGVQGKIDISDEMALHLELSTAGAADATKVADEIQKSLRKLNRNLLVLFFGLDWLLDRVQLNTENEQVRITALLDANDIAELERLAARLRKIRELASDDPNIPDLGPLNLPKKESPPASPERER